MNKTRAIFISILVGIAVIFFTVLILVMTSEQRAKNKAVNKSKKEASEVSEKKDFISIDVDKYLKLYESKDKTVVLIGRSGCEFCKIAEPILQGISHDYDFDIYYLSTDGFSDEDKTNLLNSDKYFQEEDGMPTPLLLIVRKSKIVAKVEGLISKDEYLEFFDKNKII